MSERSSCGTSFGNVKISDIDFADDAVIFVETRYTDGGPSKMLNEWMEPLGLQVSSVKINIQAFNDILDAAILSVPVCGEDVEVTLAVIFMSPHVVGAVDMDSHGFTRSWGVALLVPIQEDKSPSS